MSIFDRFVNSTGSSGAGFDLVNASNPLNWTRLAQTFAGSVLAGIVIGIQTTIDAAFAAVARLFWYGAGWLYRPAMRYRPETGLIVTIRDGIMGIIYAAWAPVSGLGWLAYPITVVEILVMLYIVTWAVSYVREEVL